MLFKEYVLLGWEYKFKQSGEKQVRKIGKSQSITGQFSALIAALLGVVFVSLAVAMYFQTTATI